MDCKINLARVKVVHNGVKHFLELKRYAQFYKDISSDIPLEILGVFLLKIRLFKLFLQMIESLRLFLENS